MILNQSHTAAPRTRRLSPHPRVHAQRQKSPRNPLARHVTRCCGTADALACPCPGAPRRASPGRLCSRASGSGGRCPARTASAATPQGPAGRRSPGTQTCPYLPRAHFREDMLRLRCSEHAACAGWMGGRAPQAWERGGWAAMVVSIMDTAVCVLTPSLYVIASLSMCRVCTLAEVWYSFSTGVHIRSWRWWARPSRGWRRRRGSGRARAGRQRGRGRAPRTARRGRRRPWC